jgi:hypothetical protein
MPKGLSSISSVILTNMITESLFPSVGLFENLVIGEHALQHHGGSNEEWGQRMSFLWSLRRFQPTLPRPDDDQHAP